MIRVFVGWDDREEAGYHTFCSSVVHTASVPVCFTPLNLKLFEGFYKGGSKDGTNAFIYSRFLVPHLCNYEGPALFVDGSDMVCLSDLAELWDLYDDSKAVQVVLHDYKTKNPVKYIGTPMQSRNDDYPRKNQSSLMLMNCGHAAWREITPAKVETMTGAELHRFSWIPDRFIGGLPIEWNWLSQEFGHNYFAKLVHYTAGIPAFKHYIDTEMADEWHKAYRNVTHVAS